VFRAIQERGEQPAAPIGDVFRTQGRALLAGVLSRIGPDVTYALFTVCEITYATTVLGLSRGQVLTAILIGSACQLGLIPLAGAISDRVNRRVVYGIAAAVATVWPFVFFPMISSRSTPLLILGVVVGLALHSFMYGPQAAFVTEQFSTRLRYTGSSLAYTIAGVFGGAVAPLAFTALQGTWGTWVPVALYVLVASVLTLAGVALGRDPDPAEDEAYLQRSAPVTPGETAAV
jgi:MFS family permease